MEKHLAQYLSLLERRVAAFRMLEAGLEESCSAITHLDLDGVHQAIAQQEHVCSELRYLAGEMEKLHQHFSAVDGWNPSTGRADQLASHLKPADVRRFRRLVHDLTDTHAQVRHKNQVHVALLRRSRRSINVLMNFFSQCAPLHGSSPAEELSTRPPIKVKV